MCLIWNKTENSKNLKSNPKNAIKFLRSGVKLEFVLNSFDWFQKCAIQLIRKGKIYSKNSMKLYSKVVQFDSTPTIGWSQIFQMLDSFKIRSKIIRFENLWFDWLERSKWFKKFDKNQFVPLIQFNSTSKSCKK